MLRLFTSSSLQTALSVKVSPSSPSSSPSHTWTFSFSHTCCLRPYLSLIPHLKTSPTVPVSYIVNMSAPLPRTESLHSDEKDKAELDNNPVYLTHDASPGAEHRSQNDVELHSNLNNINAGFSEEEVKRVRRKIDRRLLPILGALYSIALIDRTNLSAANIAGANRDLKLTVAQNYTIATLMFFVSTLVKSKPALV